MISAEEKRFVRSWQDQRNGGWASYFIMYSLIGTLVVSLFTFVVMFFFMQIYISVPILVIVPICSYIFSCILAIYYWKKNEKRLKSIIKREVAEGHQMDAANN